MSEELILSRKAQKWIFAIIVLTILIVVSIPAPFFSSVEASFVTAPETDDELREWIKAQPGMHVDFLTVVRTEDNKIRVQMLVGRVPWMRPRFPDLNSKCLELGYELSSPFQ